MSKNETSDQAEASRRPGGRSARVRADVLRSTLEVLAENGTSGLTMSEIARRSGVHATSIQRRWGAPQNLVLDALLSYSQEHLPVPDTGNLRDDMVALARLIAAYLDTPLGIALAQAMATAEEDPQLTESRALFWQSRYDVTRIIVDRAVDRHELPADADHQLALELLVAPLHFRALLIRQPVGEDRIERMVDTLLHGLAGPDSARTRPDSR
ncbi:MULTISPECIES: TetR-like C-terminal domain-containing protein [unclassified Streptomyces]|uniref:TetR-like C-terminal domain-containing protein n=1 Tax=unclassified Streptomyces TaxID=2593676 RepID=UPI00190A068C|nr:MULTISPECIES: TetR-like C-terminal domain-containing protein [unclassified Streptomyces]MBK3563647.1 TetR/AcrR family transcriptional regulator C-terminal ligand-binding domain-containing protein [Streptomyces sp. MBT62]MBK6013011.1 TetR/AcrR family transcriptional regulator C-terminal ligand-binding domain-containing protein [Streptomyces sp. MBT53]